MDERRDDEDQRQARPTEGVRIIGAEEAQAALDTGARGTDDGSSSTPSGNRSGGRGWAGAAGTSP